MNCQLAREYFPELLDGRLADSVVAEVRAHLGHCPDCQREFAALSKTLAALDHLPTPAPSPRLRANFYAMLEEEKNSAASVRAAAERSARAARFTLLKWILSPLAACALLAAGFLLGTRYSAPAPAPVVDPAMARELAELRQRVDSVGQLVGYSLLQQRSTSERLKGVLATLDQKNPDQKLLTDLVGALALDPSTNVRLSALDALYPHADQEVVRAGVLASLPREQNPLVQVAMIDFLVAARDRAATPELERITKNDTLDQSVREAAKRALAQL